MKLVRSDSPEVAGNIASARTLARRHLPMLLLGLLPNLLILAIALALHFIVSVRTAALLCAPLFLAWNVWVLWRARSPRLSWVIKARAERVYIRLYVGFGRAWHRIDTPDVLALEASEIASMSIRTVEVFVYGPKPRIVEWLMIEPTHAVAEGVSNQVPSFLRDVRSPSFGAPYLSERVYWANEERRLAVGWKRCRPALRIFLQKVVRECPSIVVGPEERSELDLNGIWHGFRVEPSAEQRRMLVQARRLGFGPDCVKLLNRYRFIPFRQCAPYLAEIEEGEAGTGSSPVQR